MNAERLCRACLLPTSERSGVHADCAQIAADLALTEAVQRVERAIYDRRVAEARRAEDRSTERLTAVLQAERRVAERRQADRRREA